MLLIQKNFPRFLTNRAFFFLLFYTFEVAGLLVTIMNFKKMEIIFWNIVAFYSFVGVGDFKFDRNIFNYNINVKQSITWG